MMRRSISIVALVLIFSVSACTKEKPEHRLITVSGEADVRVVPDEVILTLGVETWNINLNVAKSQNDERVKNVLTLAKDFEISANHVKTDHINIEPRYESNWAKKSFIGYFVHKTIVFTLKDLSKFEALMTGALEKGANYVHGVQFRTTELRRYRDEARALAIKAAQEKANALANELGQTIGQPHSIHENSTRWWSWYTTNWRNPRSQSTAQNVIQSGGDSTAEGSIAPGQITVSASVSVSFELE